MTKTKPCLNDMTEISCDNEAVTGHEYCKECLKDLAKYERALHEDSPAPFADAEWLEAVERA